jgi:hypothetical protein
VSRVEFPFRIASGRTIENPLCPPKQSVLIDAMIAKNSAGLPLALCAMIAMVACSKDAEVDDRHAASTASAETLVISDEPIDEIAGVAPASLAEEALEKYSRAALDGDGRAAYLVVVHYEMAALDRRNGEYWSQIAAENGDVDGMVNYARRLMDVADRDRCRRAIFWLKRAVQAADAMSSDDVREFAKETEDKCQKL